MSRIEEILRSRIKPKEKQMKLVEAVISGIIPAPEFIAFFEAAKDADKGTCADVMKHVGAQKPEVLAPFLGTLLKYINSELPRVKWGVPEAIGHMAKKYPREVEAAIPSLLKNAEDDEINTTVIRWCAAFALGEIAKYNPLTRKQLRPIFEKSIRREKNNGVKNVYTKALKAIEKES